MFKICVRYRTSSDRFYNFLFSDALIDTLLMDGYLVPTTEQLESLDIDPAGETKPVPLFQRRCLSLFEMTTTCFLIPFQTLLTRPPHQSPASSFASGSRCLRHCPHTPLFGCSWRNCLQSFTFLGSFPSTGRTTSQGGFRRYSLSAASVRSPFICWFWLRMRRCLFFFILPDRVQALAIPIRPGRCL